MILRSSFYNMLGAAIRLITSLLAIPLLIRMLGVETYGLWAFASALIGVVALAEAGLSLSTTVFVARDIASGSLNDIGETIAIILTLMFALASIAMIGLGLAARPLSLLPPGISPIQQHDIAQTLMFGGIVVWARMMQQVFIGLKRAYQQYGLVNLLQTAQAVGLNLGWMVVAWQHGSIVTLMQWQAALTLIFFGLHVFWGLRLLRGSTFTRFWSRAKAIKIVRYSVTTWVGLLGSALFTHVDRLIIGALLKPEVLGFYAAVTSLTEQINTLSAVAVDPQFPAITQMLAEKPIDRPALHERVRQALVLNVLVALVLGVALLAGSSWLLPIFGFYPDAIQLLGFRVAIIIYTIYSMNVVGYYVLFGTGQVFVCSATSLGFGLLSLILITIGAYTLGIMGVILGNAGYIGTCAVYGFAMRSLGLPGWAWLSWVRAPLVCFLSGAVVVLILSGQIDLALLIGCVQAIFIGLWILRTQSALIQEVRHMFSLIRVKP